MKTNQLIQVADNYLVNTTQRITHSANQPSSPANGDLWWEPGAIYPQPWEWDSANSVWISNTVSRELFTATATATIYTDYAVPFYNVTANKIKLIQVAGFIRNTGAAHDNTNYYTFGFDYLLGTGAYTSLYTITSNTGIVPSALGANGVRRTLDSPNVWLPGNAWTLRFLVYKTGTPTNIFCNFFCFLRYGRP